MKKFDAIKEMSRPWTCLLCARDDRHARRAQLPDTVLSNLRRLLDQSCDALRRADEPRIGIDDIALPKKPESEPPPYFHRLNDIARREPGRERDSALMDIAATLPGIDGVMLVGGSETSALFQSTEILRVQRYLDDFVDSIIVEIET